MDVNMRLPKGLDIGEQKDDTIPCAYSHVDCKTHTVYAGTVVWTVEVHTKIPVEGEENGLGRVHHWMRIDVKGDDNDKFVLHASLAQMEQLARAILAALPREHALVRAYEKDQETKRQANIAHLSTFDGTPASVVHKIESGEMPMCQSAKAAMVQAANDGDTYARAVLDKALTQE